MSCLITHYVEVIGLSFECETCLCHLCYENSLGLCNFIALDADDLNFMKIMLFELLIIISHL